MKEFNEMKKQYEVIDIPEELEFFVKKTIQNKEKTMKKNTIYKTILSTAAAVAVLFTGSVNFSPRVAYALSDVPVLGGLAKLVTFTELKHEEKGFTATVKVPEVQGLGDENLEKSINKKYLEEGRKLYADFQKQMGDMKEINAENLAIFSNYEIKTNSERLLVVKRVTTEIQASGSEKATFDTIDKQNKFILTLPGLFKDEKYIDLISENIKDQMRSQMKEDSGKSYFLEDPDMTDSNFDKIKQDQNFYINSDGKLVIAFDEYEVAPGSMGMVEFIIPTEVIASELVGKAYIN